MYDTTSGSFIEYSKYNIKEIGSSFHQSFAPNEPFRADK